MDPMESSGDEHDHDTVVFEDLLKNQAFLTASMRRQLLKTMVRSLPDKVQRRIKALKNLQLDHLKLEAKFYQEMYELERKYFELYQPIKDKRREIIAGNVEPTDEEAAYQSAGEEEDEEMSEKLKQMSLDLQKGLPKFDENVAGIPDFWLQVFKSTEVIADMLQPHDEPILKHLQDLKIVHDANDMAYTIEFHFSPNEYFKDAVLTKKYFLRCESNKDDPLGFEGPEIIKCTGCIINWLPGKNVCVKTIKKKQKHKARGAVRTITKQVPNDSFFNFFAPPLAADDSNMDEESEAILTTDFEIGHFLRSRLINRAVLYYCGDIVEDDESDEEEEEEATDEETGDSDEDDERPAKPAHKNKGGQAAGDGQQPAECKQS
ncbi:nucleosome assembly protein 1-like 1-A [Culicoides brevitarsis]|uniref:nucleosome assembly protein 1-like 1-A n=1 Tax=Culicoides brevitarsis TaxID=469753 RepID=UPI00307B5454